MNGTDRSEEPAPASDPLLLAAAALKRDPPPAERAGLRGDLLAAFDRERRRPLWRSRWPAALAAAAVLLVSVVLGRWSVVAERPELPMESDLASLSSRLDRLRDDLDRLEAARTAAASPGADHPIGEDRTFALASDDPALMRLVSAARFESIDAEGALSRYRDVVRRFPEGPAATVARERIRRLGR